MLTCYDFRNYKSCTFLKYDTCRFLIKDIFWTVLGSMLLRAFHCQVGGSDLCNYIVELSLGHFLLNSFTFIIPSPRSMIPTLEILRKTYLNDCKWRYICIFPHINWQLVFKFRHENLQFYYRMITAIASVIKNMQFNTEIVSNCSCVVYPCLFISWMLCCSYG
jgi:hypothetical protein